MAAVRGKTSRREGGKWGMNGEIMWEGKGGGEKRGSEKGGVEWGNGEEDV